MRGQIGLGLEWERTVVGVLALATRTLGIVLIAATPLTGSPSEPPVAFGGKDSVIDLSSGTAEVVVENNTASAWTLDATVNVANDDVAVPVVFVPGAESAVTGLKLGSASEVILELEAETLPAHGSGQLTVVARPDPQSPRGPEPQPVVLRRSIATTAATPVPAVDKWQDDADGMTRSEMSTFVPLSDAGSCVTDTNSSAPEGAGITTTTIAQLTLVDGTAAFDAVATCSGSDRAGRDSSLRVTVDGVAPGDQPTGTLKLSDDDSVDLTFTKSLPVVCALLALGVGFLLALAMRWWSDNRRSRWLVRRRIAALGTSLLKADSDYQGERARIDPPPAQLSLQPGLSDELEAAMTTLDTIVSPWPRGLRWLPYPPEQDTKRLGALVADLDRVESVIAAWRDLPKQLAALRVLTEPARSEAPNLHARAEHLLDAETHQDLATARAALAMIAEVQSLAAVFELLPKLRSLDELAAAAREASGDWEPERKSVLEEAEGRLRKVKADLLDSKDATELIRSGIDRDLRLVQASLRSLPYEPAPAIRQESGLRRAVKTRPPDVPAFDTLRREWAVRSAHATLVLRIGDVTGIALAVVVGTWSGLAALYFDKPWGSVADVVAMVVWAFATGTAVAVITEAVRLAGDTRLPSPSAEKEE